MGGLGVQREVQAVSQGPQALAVDPACRRVEARPQQPHDHIGAQAQVRQLERRREEGTQRAHHLHLLQHSSTGGQAHVTSLAL